jgi:hypothetical protein
MGYEGRMRGLEKNYESVLVELVGFQRGVAQQDGVLKSLIRNFLGEDSEFSFFLSTSFFCSSFFKFPLFVHSFSLNFFWLIVVYTSTQPLILVPIREID